MTNIYFYHSHLTFFLIYSLEVLVQVTIILIILTFYQYNILNHLNH